jgi:hypothetical protein
MSAYHLAKWFFDVLSEDGTYLLGYLSVVEFAGYRTARLSLRASPGDGPPGPAASATLGLRRRPARGILGPLPLREGRFEIGTDTSRMILQSGEAGLDLRYDAVAPLPGEPLRMSPRGRRRLLWLPVMLKARVSGRVRIGSRIFELAGQDGYLDYVSSNILPPWAPVETLHWGRLHSERCDLSWTHVRWRERSWSRMVGRFEGSPFALDDLSVVDAGARHSQALDLDWPDASRLEGRNGALGLRLSLRRERVAVESGFLAPEETGSGPFWSFLRRWAKDPKGIKFVCRADLELRSEGTAVIMNDLRCIDEYVRFRA